MRLFGTKSSSMNQIKQHLAQYDTLLEWSSGKTAHSSFFVVFGLVNVMFATEHDPECEENRVEKALSQVGIKEHPGHIDVEGEPLDGCVEHASS